MTSELYPLRFKHVYRDYIWGGDKIVRHYDREEPPGIYAESWEVSTRPEGESIIRDGPLEGMPLRELVKTKGAELLGTEVKGDDFPLLIKLIDSKDRLSVQVHPDDETAAAYGGEAKTEMWYVLDAEPGARVYAGLRKGVTEEEFRKAIETNEFEDILIAVPVSKGDAIFIPGGLVHAIDRGCLLLEVQQNSNTTYRIYDWGRTGHDGKPRELHIDEALRVIKWEQEKKPMVEASAIEMPGHNKAWEILACPYFRMERFLVTEPMSCHNDGSSFHAIFVASGEASIGWDDLEIDVSPGTSCLMPAALKDYTLKHMDVPCELLRISVPSSL